MRPILAVFPTTDRAFRTVAVERLMAIGDDPTHLQRELRRWFPRAVVRPRALSGEVIPIWYVFRDGVWTAS